MRQVKHEGFVVYRTVLFQSTFANEWQFDEHDNPRAPGARELADTLVSHLKQRAASVSEAEQHEFYGWGFWVEHERRRFYNVLNPIDQQCALTIHLPWHLIRWLLWQQPRRSFDSYCDLISNTLAKIPQISEVEWEGYRT